MMKKLKQSFCIIAMGALAVGLAGCAPEPEALVANAGFVNPGSFPTQTGGINNIRLAALREGATTLGAQGGLAWRSLHIDQALQRESAYLDNIFNINQLLLPNNVLPPILTESSDDLTLDNSNTIRSANQTYKIIAPARFVTAAPTWRTYLWMSYPRPSLPNKSLLPTSRAEAFVWDQYLQEGWKSGLRQANEIFATNLNRLKRDFLGMILYRKLVAANMISSPSVAKANLGITGNAHEMRIGDAVTRITAHSVLQLNSNKWNPILTK